MSKEVSLFEPIKGRLLEIVDEKTVSKELSFALQHIKSNKQLEKATTESKQKSVLNVAQIGLTLNPVAKEAYLVPRFNSYKDDQGNWSKKIECCLEPSYIGLIKLLTDTGSVTSINTQIVYEGDLFDMDLGSSTVKHKPYFLNKQEKGEIIGVYSIAHLKSGERQIEFMSIEDVNEIKKRSESFKAYSENKIKSCVWVSDESEMIRKTIIRRIYKYLPRTEQMERVDNAIELDNQDYKPTHGTLEYIESLLNSSVLDEREITAIYDEMNVMNNKRAYEVITYLKENQKGVNEGVMSNKAINENLDNIT